jgi:SAM-dependent methyltransferase
MDEFERKAADINRRYYDSPNPGLDDYWRKMAAPRSRVRVLLGLLARVSPANVVDLGCGSGVLLQEIRHRHPRVRLTGIDLSSLQIAQNRRASPWAEWYVANLDGPAELPASVEGSFDVVIASEVIEHLDHPAQFLGNARALARPGGHLLLSTQSGVIRETERRVGHRRHFSVGEMEGLLGRSGWQAERVWNEGFPFHDLSKWYANRNPDDTIARFGERAYGWKEDLVCIALGLAFRLNSRRKGAQLFAVARRS